MLRFIKDFVAALSHGLTVEVLGSEPVRVCAGCGSVRPVFTDACAICGGENFIVAEYENARALARVR